jgi:hypothetical protein
LGRNIISTSVCTSAAYGSVTPDHCQLTLHISKTNQRRGPQIIQISSPVAVMALWQWRHLRGVDYTHGRLLFQLGGGAVVRLTELLAHLQHTLRPLGYTGIFLTGKCFRIGLASYLNTCGASPADISVAGHWSTRSTTYVNYADNKSHSHRAREINRRM